MYCQKTRDRNIFFKWDLVPQCSTVALCFRERALIGILDDYFEGYYSEEMIESQVDQLVFEELVRERFPKLDNHLDYLGVQIAWVSGPWFLSIFMNMLPWESVLRVWDVLLFQGNRVMLFRTALALIELYRGSNFFPDSYIVGSQQGDLKAYKSEHHGFHFTTGYSKPYRFL